MKVMVTGGSGFLGAWCVVKLLQAGHDVRATIRDLAREPDTRAMVAEGGASSGERLEFAVADLSGDEGWAAAVEGCEAVLHVASPFPATAPSHEDELIAPARDGALRVLLASRDAGVRRVVITSSFAAIGYGHPPRRAPFTEADWTNVAAPDVAPYIKSKTVAERAAWDFMAREGGGLELSVINPVGIFGPVLGPDFSSSIQIIRGLLNGSVKAAPNLVFGLVDVRDCADLHLAAMTSACAAGERFLAVSGEPMTLPQIAQVLRDRLGAAASRVPTRTIPNWLVRLMASRSPRMRQLAPQVGKVRRASHAKAREVLGWSPRANEEIVVDTAMSLIERGLVGA